MTSPEPSAYCHHYFDAWKPERESESEFFWKMREIVVWLENMILIILSVTGKLPKCEEAGKLIGHVFKSGVPSE